MTGRVEHSELLLWRVEGGSADLDSLAFGLLLFADIHAVSQPPRITAFVLGISLVLFDGALVDAAHQVHDLARNGGLARVDVANEDQGARLTSLIDLGDCILIDLHCNISDIARLLSDFLLLYVLFVLLLFLAFFVGVDFASLSLALLVGFGCGTNAEVGLLAVIFFVVVVAVIIIIF